MTFRSGLLGLALLLAMMMGAAQAQLPPHRAALLDQLGGPQAKSATDPLRSSVTPTGYVRFVGAPAGKSLEAGIAGETSPTLAAEAVLKSYGELFYDSGANFDFSVKKVTGGSVRLQQHLAGIPVLGGEMVVQIGKSGKAVSISADVLPIDQEFQPSGKASLQPGILSPEAQRIAVNAYRGECDDLKAEEPRLVIFSPQVVGRTGNSCLAWQVRVLSASRAYGREVLVHASLSEVIYSWTLHHEARNRRVSDAQNTPNAPGTLRRVEGQTEVGDEDVDRAYDGLGDTYDFYFNVHGRDSIDGEGMRLNATVRYCEPGLSCPYANAFWYLGRMYFGQGFASADDVIAHELTHGVTEVESNLIYMDQSGAINESFSDIWGEFIDLTNTWGTDTQEVRWLAGEDLPIGAIRSMSNPPLFRDPDRMGSPYYYTGTEDNGGVHWNSGVGNKLAFLLTDGGTFNGQTVTPMGIETVAKLFYRVQTELLTSAADYDDLGEALKQAAVDLEWNSNQITNLQRALAAVEIDSFTVAADGDDCYDPLCLSDFTILNGSSVGSTASAAVPNCGMGDKVDMWFRYTPSINANVYFSTEGSNYDTTLAVFDACDSKTALACNDDVGPQTWSAVTVPLTAGRTVLVRLSGYQNAVGLYHLRASGGQGYCTVQVGGLVRTPDGSMGVSGVEVECVGVGTAITNFDGRFSFNVPAGWSGVFRVLSPDGFYLTREIAVPPASTNQPDAAVFIRSETDVFPPAPNPPVWRIAPRLVGGTAIEMQATPASDPSGLYYEFYELNQAPGSNNMGQGDHNYLDTGLRPDTTYRYVYRVMDAFGNVTGWSPEVSVRTPPPPLNVVAPNGGETYPLGTTQIVRWTSQTPGPLVNVHLWRGNQYLGPIATSVANTGMMLWTVKSPLPGGQPVDPSGDYQVEVYDSSSSAMRDWSNGFFAIGNAAGPILTAPNNGETLKRGKSVTIKWTMPGGKKAKVRISLYQNGEFVRTISSSTENDGKLSWKVPSIATGEYQIVVMNAADYSQRDFADKNVRITK